MKTILTSYETNEGMAYDFNDSIYIRIVPWQHVATFEDRLKDFFDKVSNILITTDLDTKLVKK